MLENCNHYFEEGGIVKHFKYETLPDDAKADNVYMYRIIAPDATHTETGEHFVVYKALYNGQKYGLNVNNGDIFIRPREQFMSEVDHTKYSHIKQHYRFEIALEIL